MLLRLLPLQMALAGPHDDAQRLREIRSIREADLIDETLLRAFFTLSGELTEDFGWVRALCTLLDVRRGLPIDALAREECSLACVRLTALLALPAIETLESGEQVVATLANAIHIGAPTYNAGDATGCGIIYWSTAYTLTLAPTTRGFIGQARAMKLLKQAIDEPMLPSGRNTRAIDDFAWRMRHALDGVLEVLGA